jgi:hypothetical protein
MRSEAGGGKEWHMWERLEEASRIFVLTFYVNEKEAICCVATDWCGTKSLRA